MTREDWIWVAIRIFGIYLLVLALVSIPDIVHSGMMAHTFWHLKGSRDASTELSVSASDVAKEMSSSGKSVAPEQVAPILSYFEALRRQQHEASSKLFSSFFSSLVSGLCKLVLFAACGIYFLRGGRLFFRLISKTGAQTE